MHHRYLFTFETDDFVGQTYTLGSVAPFVKSSFQKKTASMQLIDLIHVISLTF